MPIGVHKSALIGSSGFDLSTPVDISTAVYTGKSLSLTGLTTSPTDVHLSLDGLLMYVLGGDNAAIYQYDLGTAFDLSTAVYNSVSFSVLAQEGTPTGMHLSEDGLLLYVTGTVQKAVYQYDLSTAFNISTASYATKSLNLSGEVGTSAPRGVHMSTDGAIMYTLSANLDQVYQYDLSTAFDLSTAAYSGKTIGVSEESLPLGLYVSDDGVDLYVSGSGSSSVWQYEMATPFDLSTATYTSKTLDVSTQDISPSGIHINYTASMMYISASSSDFVFQYSL